MGDRLGVEGQVVIDGLPTLADVEQAEEDLRMGSRSAKSILSQFSPRAQ